MTTASFTIPLPPSLRWKGRPIEIGGSTAARFAEKYKAGASDDCWMWKAHRDPNGYGRFGIGSGKSFLAHRIAYALHHGSIPTDLDILHSCDNPGCVNPSHLQLGTHAQNMADMKQKGRAPKAQGPRHPKSKLTWAIVGAVRASTERGCDLAARYGVSQTLITSIRKNKCWRVA